MSTRGLLAFHVDGQAKATYNHSDSYPGGLGLAVLEFLKEHVDSDMWAELKEQVRALKPIADPHTAPTAEEWEKFSQFASTAVGAPGERSWYQLLRQTQGEPSKILAAGYFEDAFRFGYDGLFCEFAYVIDLGANVLDVYRGFMKPKEVKGLWHTRPADFTDDCGGYGPVHRVASYGLSDLPAENTFCEMTEADAD